MKIKEYLETEEFKNASMFEKVKTYAAIVDKLIDLLENYEEGSKEYYEIQNCILYLKHKVSAEINNEKNIMNQKIHNPETSLREKRKLYECKSYLIAFKNELRELSNEIREIKNKISEEIIGNMDFEN